MEPADTRARMLTAAHELWRAGGFTAVTTRAVAARAGVNEVTVYRHFSCKDGLLQALVEDVTPMRAAGSPEGVQPQNLAEDLGQWARTYLEHALPVGDVILLGLVEARARPELGAVCLRVPQILHTTLAAHLEALCAEGRLPPGPFLDVAWLFYSALFSHVITSHLNPDRDWDALSDSVASVFAASLESGRLPAASHA